MLHSLDSTKDALTQYNLVCPVVSLLLLSDLPSAGP